MAKAIVPAFTLGPEPRIESREQAAQVLQELTWLDAQADKVESELNTKIGNAKTAAEKKLELEVLDPKTGLPTKTSVTSYAQLLRVELERWALESPAEFATEKTMQLSHGSIAYRVGPPSIDSIGDAKAHKERIAHALHDELTALLKKHGYVGVWRLELAPELKEMGKAIKDGTKSRGDLQKLGFCVIDGKPRAEVTVGVTTEKKAKGK